MPSEKEKSTKVEEIIFSLEQQAQVSNVNLMKVESIIRKLLGPQPEALLDAEKKALPCGYIEEIKDKLLSISTTNNMITNLLVHIEEII